MDQSALDSDGTCQFVKAQLEFGGDYMMAAGDSIESKKEPVIAIAYVDALPTKEPRIDRPCTGPEQGKRQTDGSYEDGGPGISW